MLKIEGTMEFEGKTYEAFDFRKVNPGEFYADSENTVRTAQAMTIFAYPILREVKPPHQYKVGDWVRVLRETHEGLDPKSVNTGHPIGSVRQVSRIMPNGLLGVDGSDWCLRPANVEPCDPPDPKYRPFASAEEFKPHRDKWWRSKACLSSVCPPAAYSETHWHGFTWDDALAMRVFDDGSPCGVLVTE